MFTMKLFILFSFISGVVINVSAYLHRNIPNQIFDYERYKNVIDDEECEKQVNYMKNENILLFANCKFYFIFFKFYDNKLV